MRPVAMSVAYSPKAFGLLKCGLTTNPALCVSAVGPVAQIGVHRTGMLRLTESVAAPGHHVLLQPPQNHVSEGVLPVLLSDVDEVASVTGDARRAREVLRVGEQAAPLRLEQVDHVQVLGLRLAVRAVRRQKVDVRVPAEPPLLVHVRPAFQSEVQPPLARLNLDLRAERLVLEPTRHVHDYLASRQPPLARAVDVGVRDLPQAQVAAHVLVHVSRLELM